MTARMDSYFSIKIARFLMKLVGFWTAENKKQQIFMNCALYYTIVALTTSIFTTVFDIYFSFNDFYGATYAACAFMPVLVCLVKVTGFIIHRPLVMQIIRYTQDNFWNFEYDDFGKAVIKDTDRKGIILICSFTFFVQGTVVCYITTPLIGKFMIYYRPIIQDITTGQMFRIWHSYATNMMSQRVFKNDSDRILAFNIWLNVPASETPYYEMFSVLLGFACAHSGLCFCCFDNFLCMLNIHAAAQFKILQHRIESIYDVNDLNAEKNNIGNKELSCEKYSQYYYDKFKDCVRRHHALIKYVQDLEQVFAFLVLGQLLVSSVMLCVAGFQAVQTQGTIIRRLIFIAHTLGSTFQLLVITVTANEIIIESDGIATAAYSVQWNCIPYNSEGKKIRDGLIMVMIRARKPCCITAGRFFPVSLETFTKVTTTSMSYFTILRQMEQDINESK